MGHHEDEKPEEDEKPAEDEKPVDDNAAVTNEGEKEGQETGDEAKAQTEDGQPGAESNPEKKKKSSLEDNGLVPMSWFVTIFGGECGGSCLDHKHLLPLWDNVLTKGDHSWKYFLAIAVLEKNSDVLLMSRGEELKQGLEKILDFQETPFAEESFVGASEDKSDANGDEEMVSEWLLSAKSLIESTPSSVIELLRSADDRAVASALKVRQTQVDKELQAQLDAHEAARTKESEERDKEAERSLNKARLTAYYRTYNPEKMDTIDQILKLFDGRMGVLNDKLKNKYGKGFLPDEALKDQTRSFLMSVNQSYNETRRHVSVAVAERRKKNAKSMPESRSHTMVALEVSTTEVIPVICTTKAHNLATGKKMSPPRRTSDTVDALQFYLVDCRPESIAAEQGRFPTAVSLSPEKLQDPDELQKLTDMFESLRGAVHICVMGEGFASFPVLYNHSLSKAEEMLLEDDLARTGDCALFFLKKGFPFVSVLRGGFAAAHAYLERNGSPLGMAPTDVLIDYDPVVSLFAQLETARQEEDQYKNAPAREKTARTLQKIIDNSMTRLTLEEQRINNLANDLAKPETVVKMKQSVSNFLAKPKSVPSIGFGRTPPLFMSKKFAASTKKEESEPTQEDDNAKSVMSFTEKINLKMPSLHSDLSNTALSDKGSEVDEKENDTASGPEASPDLGASSNEGKVEDSASDGPSKISSAFTSLTQRMQQSNATVAPDTESGKERVGSKMSFSSFASRIKHVTDAKGSEESKESAPEISSATTSSSDKEHDGGVGSDGPSKVSSAFASLTQRMHHSTATAAPASDSGQPTSEGDPAKKESTVSKISFSGFANRIKLGQQSAAQPTNPSDKAAEGKVSEEKKDSTSEKSEEEPKTGVTRDNAADGGRFTKFTKSIGGTLSGLRETAADDKVSEENEDSIPKKSEEEEVKTITSTDNATNGGRFTKFTKSIGGTLSGLRETAADDKVSEENEDSIPKKSEEEEVKIVTSTDNPIDAGRFTKFSKSIGGSLSGLRLSHSKSDSSDPKKSSEGEEPDSMTKALSSIGNSSLGKLLLEDEPRPKTRFQRLEEEESISFDDDNNEAKASSTNSQEGGELNDLFDDDSAKDEFADVSLSDGDEEETGDVEEKPDGDEAKLTDAL